MSFCFVELLTVGKQGQAIPSTAARQGFDRNFALPLQAIIAGQKHLRVKELEFFHRGSL